MKKTLAALGAAAVGAVAVRDLTQKQHALKRNFPVVANLRYLLEAVGPELRQYIVTGNDDERPFSRDQRRWVYASSKLQNNYFGFGTDNDLEGQTGYPIIKQRTFADVAPSAQAHSGEETPLPSAKVMGLTRGRAKAFRPESIVNISGMSFGSLSSNAITALNKGAQLAGCMQNTGEGALSPYHRQGADLVVQIGTSYFGCRDQDGRFDPATRRALCRRARPDDRDQAVAGCQARARWHVARRQGDRGDRPDPWHHGRCGLRVPEPACRLQRRRLDARLRGDRRGRDRAAGGHQERRGQHGLLGRADRGDVSRADGRLRQHRRRRGWHRRGAAGVRRLRGLPVPGRLRQGLQAVRRGRADRRHHLHRGRQAWAAGQRPGRLRARLRHDQRRPRGDAGHRLHPGAEVPHRRVPDRRRHPAPVADARSRPGVEVGARGQLHQDAAARPAQGLRGRRGPHPALITADDIDLIDGLMSSRPLREVYGYGRHWGTVGPALAEEITAIMAEAVAIHGG